MNMHTQDQAWLQYPPLSTSMPGPVGNMAERVEERRPSLPLLRINAVGNIRNHSNLTPPETPISPRDGTAEAQTAETLFHNYLRAFHPFDPSTNLSPDQDASSITVPIKEGDLILVHSIHANGWADGTLLTTGERGWLPTNYCEAYDHPYIRSLLNAMTQFWDLLGDNENASFATFVRQDYIRGLIAGVRYLLEHTGCLHRDADLVMRHAGIRRMRKGLLADLSSVVHKAKELQDEASQPYAGEVVHIILDELIAKAFRVVTRAVRFVDIWQQEAASTMEDPTVTDVSGPSRTAASSVPMGPNLTSGSTNREPQDLAKGFLEQPSQESASLSNNSSQAPIGESRHKRSSSQILPLRSGTTSHRMSLVRNERRQGTTASEQLAKTHDLCIGHIGKLLGHHLQSRSPSELVATTRDLVDACKQLLAIMDAAQSHESPRVISMRHSENVFRNELEELVKSTKEVFNFSPDEDVVILPNQITRLVSIGTRLIRAVGECVANTRRLLEQTGDFEYQVGRKGSQLPGSEAVNQRTRTTVVEVQAVAGATHGKRLSLKALPPAPPPISPPRAPTTANAEFPPATNTVVTVSPNTYAADGSRKSLQAPPTPHRPAPLRPNGSTGLVSEPLRSPMSFVSEKSNYGRKDSVSTCFTEASGVHVTNFRDSEVTVASETSTRATTPEKRALEADGHVDPMLLNSFASISSITSGVTEASFDPDASFLHKSFAHELILNQQGQVAGGSLEALVEQLTTHDSAPDQQFATAFYQTFRHFTTPRKLAQAMIERFDYIGDSKTVGKPARLRVCNFFKGWMETYWNGEADRDALGEVRYFALHKVKPVLPTAAERLLELMRKVTAAYNSGTAKGPLVSGVGKGATSMIQQVDTNTIPDSLVSKSQLSMLREANAGDGECDLLELDPTELARQLTLLTSRAYCEIQPEELLSLGWNKKDTSKAQNVRAVSKMNTDLAYVVGDSILSPEEAKKRALVIKHWIKVAMQCLEMRNFESLMAIVASMDSSMVQRLRRTWEIVSKKNKARFEELKAVIDVSQNYASLRKRMETATAPCLPFLGVYLTDLTFIDAGNPSTRQLSGPAADEQSASVVINFDKYARMARVVAQIQRYQVPYQFRAVTELQKWLEGHLQRMRKANSDIVCSFHRRSLILEPRVDEPPKMPEIRRSMEPPITTENVERPKTASGSMSDEKGEDPAPRKLFLKGNTFGFKAALSRYDSSSPLSPPLPLSPSKRTHSPADAKRNGST